MWTSFIASLTSLESESIFGTMRPFRERYVDSIIETSRSAFASEAYGLWGVFSRPENAMIGFAGF
jgi:hypothetical protein